MKVLMVEGLFTEPRVYGIYAGNDFIDSYAVDHMLQRSISKDHIGTRWTDADYNYEQVIKEHDAGPVPFGMISKGFFEHSEPGFIYLLGTIEEMRALNREYMILMTMYCPTAKLYVDLTIDPRAYAYGMELPSHVAGGVAWLAVEPGIADPVKVTPVSSNMRQYLRSLAYR